MVTKEYRLLKAFEYRIYPNIEQRNQIHQHFGTGFKTNQTIPVERRDFKPVENQTSIPEIITGTSYSSMKQEAIAFRQ